MNKIIKKNTIIIFMSLIVLSCKNNDETFVVENKKINEAVYASGELYPEEYQILKCTSADRILEIFVKEGDIVEQGEILVQLGTTSAKEQIEILVNQVTIANENMQENSGILSELQYKIKLAKQQHDVELKNSNRFQDLLKDKAVSEKDAEQAFISAETKLIEYNKLLEQYKAQKKELTNQLLDAKSKLTEAQKHQKSKVLISNICGKVYNINIKEGDVVKDSEDILMIGSIDKYKLELIVDERDIRKIKIGQKVFFETEAYESFQFEAIIEKINPVLDKNLRSFNIEAKIISNENFYPQSSVEANILIRENESAVLVPSKFLLSNDTILVKLENGDMKPTKVICGIKNGDWVEIISGINIGSTIIKK